MFNSDFASVKTAVFSHINETFGMPAWGIFTSFGSVRLARFVWNLFFSSVDEIRQSVCPYPRCCCYWGFVKCVRKGIDGVCFVPDFYEIAV